MDWDHENPEVPPDRRSARHDVVGLPTATQNAAVPPDAPPKTVTITGPSGELPAASVRSYWSSAIGGARLHPRTRRREALADFRPRRAALTPTPRTLRAASVTDLPRYQIPIGDAHPQNTKADKAAAKIAAKVDPGLVDITSTFASASGTAEGTGMILTSNGLVLTNNHVVEDAETLSVRDVATNATYVGQGRRLRPL